MTLERAHIDELWRRMVATYGHRWTSNYGDVDEDDTWLLGLQGIRPDELGYGYMAAIDHYREWPPSLPEFRALCKAPLPRPEPYVKVEPRTPEEKASALEHIKSLRKLLKHKRREQVREEIEERSHRFEREPGQEG